MKRVARDISHAELAQLSGHSDEPGLIIEAGSNDGTDSLRLLDAFPKSRILCFEPDPRAFAKLADNLRPVPRALTSTLCLGDSWYGAVFHQSSGNPYSDGRECDWDKSGSLLTPTEHLKISSWCEFKKDIAVQVGRLDGFLASLSISDLAYDQMPIPLMWLDCQGSELQVLDGAPKALARTRVLKIESHPVPLYDGAPTESEITKYLEARGMEVVARYAEDLVAMRASS